MTRRRIDGSEDGYALIAAVASIAVFAAMSLAVLDATRGSLIDAGAEQAQLHASAAADAGVAIAIQGLLADDADRWSIDGRQRDRRFGAARLRIRIEDERGKVPINLIEEPEATRLLEAAGFEGERLLVARDSLLDWIDPDEMKRPFGAEGEAYRGTGVQPADAFLATLDELGSIRGFDAAAVARIRSFATVDFGSGSFDSRYADPRAIAIMVEGGASSPAAIDRERDLSGQRTALAFEDAGAMIARPLTVAVEARLPDGARASRRVVIELTGSPARPYVVRSYN